MKIVHATWENRNFGCDVFEITLDRKDLKDFQKTYAEIDAQLFANCYVVLKMPVGDLHALHKLEDEGFRFLETQLFVKDHFEPTEDVKAFQASFGELNRVIVEKKEEKWEEVIAKITPGMFSTDRVSLDPALSPEIACLRYQNWCRDLFKNPDSWMWLLNINGEAVSFSVDVFDKAKQISHGIVGGVFEKYKNEGYGVLQTFTDSEERKKGKTSISSNNHAILKLYQQLGRIIYKEMYVLRKIFN